MHIMEIYFIRIQPYITLNRFIIIVRIYIFNVESIFYLHVRI